MGVPLIVLVGPTAVGKSCLAHALAERVGGEIVSADSMQVYRGLDIGTSKPNAEERARIPHHLLDIVEPDRAFSAADYAILAHAALSEIRERGQIPIMVGGSGLYLRALFRGLFDGPAEETSIRETLRKEAVRVGVLGLHQRLATVDAEAAAAIHPNDLFRIVRALEVVAITGRPISVLREEGRWHHQPPPGPVLWFGLERDRHELYQRIETRVEEMLARGFLDEVQWLLDRGYAPSLKPLRAIGYRHLIGYLQGRSSLERACACLQRDTRRYAKRQLTWFRHEGGIEWHRVEGPVFSAQVLDSFIERIEASSTRSA